MNLAKEHTRVITLAAILIAALTLVYWNHFDNDFHFDDIHTIVNNDYITDIKNLPLIFRDARTTSSLPTNQDYRPVITTLNTIDYWIAGKLDVRVFHWHIFLELLILLTLLYSIALRLFESASGKQHYFLAVFTTAFFAFHTATAETINYIISRSDGFSTLMVLAAFLLYTRNTGWSKQWALLPFVIGCLAKPTTLMLAPILCIYELFIENPSLLVKTEQAGFSKKLRQALTRTMSFFVVGVAMYAFMISMLPDTWSPGNESALHYLNTQPFSIWIYLKTFVLPTGLSADTDLVFIRQLFAPKMLWGLLVIAVMLTVTWFSLRKRETLPIGFGILWFFIALIPTSSVVPLSEVMNHHRTFFPYVGLVLASSWGLFLLIQKFQVKTIAVAVTATVFLAAHAWGTWHRNEIWHSNESLWLDVTVKSPGNGRGLMNYGLALMRKGDAEGAIEYFEKALLTNFGKHPYLFVNLGIAKGSLANRTNDEKLKSEAEAYLRHALQLGYKYPQTHFFYGSWLHDNGRSDEALDHVQRALRMSPAHKGANRLRYEILLKVEGNIDKAAELAAEINTPEAWLDLSLKFYNLEQYENTINASNKAIALRPAYAQAYNNICSAHNSLHRYQQAVAACEKSLSISPGYQLAQNNLSWARKQLEKSR
jgi:tetratricopeptide (TPR) repeat protein